MRAFKRALKMSGVLLAMGLFATMLLPGTAEAQGVSIVSVEPETTDEQDTFVNVRVTLSRPVTTTTSVRFATSSDTAKSGEDFWGKYRVVEFAPGERIAIVPIYMINDRVPENTEQFNVRIWDLQSDSNVVTGATHAKITVRDDDGGSANPTVNVEGTTINEGADFVHVRVKLSQAVTEHSSVKFATGGGSAQPGQDYYGTFEIVEFAPGEHVKVVRIDMVDDNRPEPNEQFKVRIWDAENLTINSNRAFVQINDND